MVELKAGTTESNTKIEGGNATIKIIAGNIGDVKSKVQKSVPLTYFHVKLDPKAVWTFAIPKVLLHLNNQLF